MSSPSTSAPPGPRDPATRSAATRVDDDALLIRQRHATVARQRRRTRGWLRSLGRSNRLFPRKLVVTRDGKWIIAMALLLGIGAVNTGNNLLYLVLSLLISIIAISGVLSEANLKKVTGRRQHPRELEAGEPTMLRTEVLNAKGRGAFNIEVDEVIEDEALALRPGYALHLRAGEVGQTFLMARARRRGPVVSAGLRVSTSYPFGFARKSRVFDEPARWLVLPPVLDQAVDGVGSGGQGHHTQTRTKGLGSEFLGLRDWRPGDARRDLHWKISARRGRLIAREWEAEATRAALLEFVHVAPDDGDDPRLLDDACARVAGMCAALLDEGMAVGLRTFAGTVPPEPDSDGAQLLRIRRLLAVLVLADRPPPPTWPLEDGDWVARVRAAWAVHDRLAAGHPLVWPDGRGPDAHERVRVTFASRAEVQVDGRPPTVDVQLAVNGDVVSVERPQSDLQGVA